MQVFAQTGIGTPNPDPSAKLDITATDKGFLPPRVTLTSSTDATTIPSPATGLLVYNTGNNAGLRAGYYYWNGTDWTTIATPISAQIVDYVSVMLTTDQSNFSIGQNVKFQTIQSGNIPYDINSGNFSLTAGKTYRLTALASLNGNSPAGSSLDLIWRSADGTNLSSLGSLITASSNSNFSGQGVVDCIFTPSVNTTVSLYITWVSSSNTVLRAYSTNATITQIGSSAIINPWVLSGTNTYNTTGNVGIGTTSPTNTLDVTGTMRVSGLTTFSDFVRIGSGAGDEGGEFQFAIPATNTTLQNRVNVDIWRDRLRFFEGSTNAKGVHIDLSKAPNGASGELLWKSSGLVNAGDFVQLDNIRATVTTTGNRGLSLATVSGSFSCNIGGHFFGPVVGSSGTAGTATITTTATTSIFGWGFPTQGDTSTYIITDLTNSRAYRIILQIGGSYQNNLITIERLF